MGRKTFQHRRMVWALVMAVSGFAGWAEGSPAQQVVASEAVAANLPEAPEPVPAKAEGVPNTANEDDLSLAKTPQRMLRDEWHIVSSPSRIRGKDLRWLIPLAGVTAAAIATDSRAMRDVVSTNPGFNSANNTTSDVIRDLFVAAPVVMFGAGELTGQRTARDTGLLAGEAMIHAYATDEAIKYITLRERPQISNARGHFFAADAASDPSFVSGHTTVAWSSAAVLAGVYSRPWQQAGIYGAASAVSLTRVLAQQHFPSDVLLGSAAGWLIGHYVLRAHRPEGHGRRALLKQEQVAIGAMLTPLAVPRDASK